MSDYPAPPDWIDEDNDVHRGGIQFFCCDRRHRGEPVPATARIDMLWPRGGRLLLRTCDRHRPTTQAGYERK